MLGPIGMQELIIIFVIALIVFGPRKLPQLGKSLGRSIAEFKRASNELRSTLEQEIRVEETRKEIMEPIETLSKEAKAVVDDATRLEPDAEDLKADVDAEDLKADVDSATSPDPAPSVTETASAAEDSKPAKAEETNVAQPVEPHETKA